MDSTKTGDNAGLSRYEINRIISLQSNGTWFVSSHSTELCGFEFLLQIRSYLHCGYIFFGFQCFMVTFISVSEKYCENLHLFCIKWLLNIYLKFFSDTLIAIIPINN